MGNIKALRPEVYNLIAAGEVVDNPFGAVKELVENSVDAGARRITIEVSEGGFEQIVITDNGCGIAEEDVELAFAKYATSKLESADDLKAIMSLGFRGEALSSIAAVSRIKLTTRTNDTDTGVCVRVEKGVVCDKQYVPANVGTKIEVRDLYFNTPVRKNFLKNPAGEKAEITKFVTKFILTNPNIAFTYRADGKTVFETTGNGLDEAIFAVYGEDCLSNCIPINYNNGDLRITGYIGAPSYSKANRNYQILAVNGRIVADAQITASIATAYKSYLMQHRFPFYILNLEIRPDMVEVNIHPKKSEVRFQRHRFVAGQFYHAVQEALEKFTYEGAETIFSFSKPNTESQPQHDTQSAATVAPQIARTDFAKMLDDMQQHGEIDFMNPAQRADVEEIEEITEAKRQEREFDEFAKRMGSQISVARARQSLGFDKTPEVQQEIAPIVMEESIPSVTEYDEGDDLFVRARILGAAFRTYLILELEDKIIFVDQHAAHERLLFDKFLAGAQTQMQQLMVPYTFSVMDDEALFIEANLKNILSAGIEVQKFGHNTFRITAVSSLLVNTKMDAFVQFLLSSIDEFKLDDRQLIVEAIAKKACKAAVKAGQKLDEDEIKYILKEVYHNKILQCPHGRPITVVFTKTQFEKLFKRIV